VEKYGTAGRVTSDNMIQHLRFACWIAKVTDTKSKATMVVRTRLNITCIRTLHILLVIKINYFVIYCAVYFIN
jgi:hypothetical protein